MTINLTPRQLAERWSVSVGSLANNRSAGIGPSYLKIGSRVLYPVAEIEAYERRSLVETVAL